MPTITTLGHPSKRTEFTYTGSVKSGVILEYTGRPHVSEELFNAILHRFNGQTIPGGFSMTNPPPGGLGDWVQLVSPFMNTVKLTPRHASHIAAILAHESHITTTLLGSAVILHFKDRYDWRPCSEFNFNIIRRPARVKCRMSTT